MAGPGSVMIAAPMRAETRGDTGLWSAMVRDARHYFGGLHYQNPHALKPMRIAQMLASPEFRLVVRYRVYRALYRRGFRGLAYLLYVRAKAIHGCDISFMADIGPGMRIEHCSDIVIGPDARIGSDAYIFNGVTLGKRLSRHGADGMPTVGHRVILGTGAKILGPIHVGDDARIGANAVVLVSVPAGATAVGNPAQVVRAGRSQ